jgi:hypothetical protein
MLNVLESADKIHPEIGHRLKVFSTGDALGWVECRNFRIDTPWNMKESQIRATYI